VKNAPLTRPGPRRPLAAAATASALTLAASAALANDPICLNWGATVCGGVFSTLPRDSVSCATTSSTFAWDWSRWYVSMDRVGGLNGCDTLTIIGLPTGQPVLLRARVRAIADFDAISSLPTSGFTYDLWFYGPHQGIGIDGIVNPGDPPIHYDQVQEMPLACVAGVPFALNLQFSGSGQPGKVARFRSLLEFLDLPEGATIVSARGGGGPTPLLHESWGQLKFRYH